jgi:hypothetical protein
MASKINFYDALKETSRSVPLITQIIMGVIIGLIITGVTVYQVVAGNISVPTAVLTYLNGTLVTSLVANFTTIMTVLGVALALLIVVIIIKLFSGFTGGNDGDSM